MLRVYFPDDIAHALTAVTVAALQASAASGANVEYLHGVLATARAMALSFGVEWATIKAELLACIENADILETVSKSLLGGGM